MITITKSVTHLILAAGVTAFLPLSLAWAADEDMSSSVYLKFDPETGDFVTVEDPSRTRSQQHQAAGKQQAASAAAAAQQQDATDTAATQASATPAQDETTAATPSPLMIGSVVALLALVAGAVVWIKRSPAKQAT